MLGYAFVDLTDDEKRQRRHQLDWHATYAQISVLIVLLLIQVSVWLDWVLNQWLVESTELLKSPHLPSKTQQRRAWLRKLRQSLRKARWWAHTPVVRGWGTYGEWMCGIAWTGWTLYLCMRNTAPDYFHLTKRFGIVAAALLPFQYLLAMRSSYSPIALLTRLSHEDLKGSHIMLGKIVTTFFSLHGLFYLNFYVQQNLLWGKLQQLVPVLGMVSLTLWIIMSTSGLSYMRNWSYRLFYIIHASLAWLILIPMYFHVHHIRPYIWQTLAVVILLNIFRIFKTRTYSGDVSLVSGTDLVRISVPLALANGRSRWQPGQHVYLSRPTGRPLSLHEIFVRVMQVNPFTVASVPHKDDELVLIARTLKGSTRLTSDLAKSLDRDEAAGKGKRTTTLTIEGPYGNAKFLPDLSTFDKILFVAGGVGATFVIPLYRFAVAAGSKHARPQTHLVWTVRSVADIRWALPLPAASGELHDQVEVYVTGTTRVAQNHSVTDPTSTDGDEIELAEGEHLLGGDEVASQKVEGAETRSGRPDINHVIDETFADAHGKVAVFVCGPVSLAESTRRAVGRWVYRDAEVFFRAEAFGY